MKTALLTSFFLLGLSGCGLVVQNPSSAYSPVNAQSSAESSRLMLQGYDVVAYFTDNQARQGDKAHRSQYAATDFYFASSTNKTLFDASPEKYLPQFGGFCVNGILYAIPMGGDPGFWRIYDDKLYIFGSERSIKAFELDRERHLQLAHTYWNDEIAGHNSVLRRYWRMLWRVPHYKSSQQIIDEVSTWEARQGTQQGQPQ